MVAVCYLITFRVPTKYTYRPLPKSSLRTCTTPFASQIGAATRARSSVAALSGLRRFFEESWAGLDRWFALWCLRAPLEEQGCSQDVNTRARGLR